MAQRYSSIGKEHHVLAIQNDGLIVRLDDGSVWDVSVGEHTKTICWYLNMRVVVEESGDPVFGFVLRNLDTVGPDTVRARPK
jgi:hypothetical protein